MVNSIDRVGVIGGAASGASSRSVGIAVLSEQVLAGHAGTECKTKVSTGVCLPFALSRGRGWTSACGGSWR
jgi:hypothetical protein